MSTQTQAPAPTSTTVNAGILAMRAANAARKLGLAPRTPTAPKPPKTRQVSARKPAPDDAPETLRAYRVCVLVRGEGDGVQTHLNVAVDAAGPRRAGRQARALAAQAGHETVGVCAIATEDAPQAVWAALAPV